MFGKSRKGKGLWVNCRGLILLFSLTLLFIIGFLNVSGAAEYPTKPIQVIAAFPPGGGSDIAARIISPKISALIGQPVVVVNKTGGGGVMGTYAVLAAPPDGYTILVHSPPMILAPLIYKDVTFNLLRDFAMVNLAVTTPNILVVKKDSPWLTLEELIVEAKKNPGKLTCSVAGYGSSHHFAAELFKMETGIDITSVPMDGAGPAVTAVLGGHINITIPELGAVHKYMQVGSLRALAVMANKRLKDFPDVPTAAEKGFPSLISVTYQGFAVPAKTPREIVERLEKVFKEAINDREIIELFEKTGWVVENLGSKGATEFLAKEQQVKSEVAKAAKIVPK